MKPWKIVLATLVASFALVGAGLGIYAWSGAYAIGADVPHWKLTYNALDWFREQAVEHHAASVQVPPDLESPARIREGAEHYAEMCTGCHLKPGVNSSEIREGLYPKPPDFSRMDHAIDPREAFWIIKHGIKMSGMPAWGASHSDDKIWAMAAFVRKLPGMTPEQYAAYTAQPAGNDDHGDNGHAHAAQAHEHAAATAPHDATPAAGKDAGQHH